MNKVFSATAARKNFFQLLNIASRPGFTVTITHEGHPPLILLSQDEFESWQETAEIMSDPQLMKDIRAGMKEKGTVRLETLEKRHAAKKHVRRRS